MWPTQSKAFWEKMGAAAEGCVIKLFLFIKTTNGSAASCSSTDNNDSDNENIRGDSDWSKQHDIIICWLWNCPITGQS